MKKSIAGLLAVILLLGLCACGSGSSSDPNLGVYYGDTIDILGEEPMSDAYPGENYIELEANGKGTWMLDGDSTSMEWALDGQDFTMTVEDEECVGTLSDGVITIDFFDMGIIMTFAEEGAETSAAGSDASGADTETGSDASSADAGQTALQDYWNGAWYGWWIVDDGYGYYSDWGDGTYWYDCCAYIDIDEDGIGTIELWDEDGSRDDLMAYADISVGYGTTDAGCMMSEDGWFWDADISSADWIVDPGASDVSDYDHMICIDGEYVDPTDSDNSFYFYIYLRPWGMEWDDVNDYYMPCYYYDWYLPCIEAGEEMPDSIFDDDYEPSDNGTETSLDADDGSDSDDTGFGIHGNDGPPEGAPAGGDGMTGLDYDGLNAKSDSLYQDYSYDEMKELTYADIVALMDGVEGEYEDDGLDDYWSYNWHGTDGTYWNVKFYAETGLFYTSATYDF